MPESSAREAVRPQPEPFPSFPEEDAGTSEADDPPEATVEVAPTGVHRVAEQPEGTGPAAGEGPTRRCPSCGYDARVDMVDLVGNTTHFSCTNCGTLWQVRGLYTAAR